MDDKYLIKKKPNKVGLEWAKRNSAFLVEIIIALCLGIATIIVSDNQNSLIEEQTINLKAQKDLMEKQTALIERQIQNSFLFDSLQSFYTKKQTELTDQQLNIINKENLRKNLSDKKDLPQDIIEIDNSFKEMLEQIRYDVTSHPAGTSWDQTRFGVILTKAEKLLQKYFETNLLFKHSINFDRWLNCYLLTKEINMAIGKHYSVESLRAYTPKIDTLKRIINDFLLGLK